MSDFSLSAPSPVNHSCYLYLRSFVYYSLFLLGQAPWELPTTQQPPYSSSYRKKEKGTRCFPRVKELLWKSLKEVVNKQLVGYKCILLLYCNLLLCSAATLHPISSFIMDSSWLFCYSGSATASKCAFFQSGLTVQEATYNRGIGNNQGEYHNNHHWALFLGLALSNSFPLAGLRCFELLTSALAWLARICIITQCWWQWISM